MYRTQPPVLVHAAARCLILPALMLIASSAATAQSVASYNFTPHVIRSDRTDPVVLEAAVTGGPASVQFEYTTVIAPGTLMPMHDDGVAGDAVAGDGVYSVQLTASQVVSGLQADDVFRRFVGFIWLGATRVNVFASIWTPSMMALPVVDHSTDLRVTAYVANIRDDAFFADRNYARIIARLLRAFPDRYDVVNVVFARNFVENRFHSQVKNATAGIGLPAFDASSGYGSSGRLLGFTAFPSSVFFDGADEGYQHELGHQWINFLDNQPLAQGSPHWPYSSLATGIMGVGAGSQGLVFPCTVTQEAAGVRVSPFNGPRTFTDLDLYLMGLLPASDVGVFLVLDNQASAPNCDGSLYTGTTTTLSVADVIAGNGPRVPAADSAAHRFRAATVVVTRGTLLDDDALAFYSFFARRAELGAGVASHIGFWKGTTLPFAVSTGGRGSLGAHLFVPAARAARDFDGDDRTDMAVYRPSTGTWFAAGSASDRTRLISRGWGSEAAGDVPVTGDFDGDGLVDPAVFRASTGTWFILESHADFTTWNHFGWGTTGDTLVPADYDGDGKSDGAVYRASTGTWYVKPSSGATQWNVVHGAAGDIPVPGDYDGDGKADIAVYRPSTGTWFVLHSSDNYSVLRYRGWGVLAQNDRPAPGDYDGDGKTDFCVFRPASGTWFILESHANFTTWNWFGWGSSTDTLAPNDYDGDGITDAAVYRPSTGTWYVRPSSGATQWSVVFGQSGDMPLLQVR
jgi:hypothetical protein